MATQITTNEFQEKVLNSSVPVLVDFSQHGAVPAR